MRHFHALATWILTKRAPRSKRWSLYLPRCGVCSPGLGAEGRRRWLAFGPMLGKRVEA